ncbi:MAG: hypothetical protein O7G30_16850 [Proteobacteria bacterium]|nr:hypothetical protein [Pseudomonadota bacterium]
MQPQRVAGLTVGTFLVFHALGGSAWAEEPAVRFALCKGNVASVSVLPAGPPNDAFAVAVQLTREATRVLETLSRESAGRSLEVFFGSWLFLRARIGEPIRSGLLANRAYASAEEAAGARHQLQAQLPESPCGGV